MSEEKGLSTEFASAYKIKEEPKNIKIEIGRYYTLSNGSYGTFEAKIVSIRKVNDEILIYYKHTKDDGKFLTTWIHGQATLETFRAQLLEFGQINSIDLLYPQRKDGTEYYPNK